MACANAFVFAIESWNLCYYEWAVVVMVLIFLPSQIRSLHGLHKFALASDGCAVLVLGSILFDIIYQGRLEGVETGLGPPEGVAFLTAYNGISSVVFAYQGQSSRFCGCIPIS